MTSTQTKREKHIFTGKSFNILNLFHHPRSRKGVRIVEHRELSSDFDFHFPTLENLLQFHNLEHYFLDSFLQFRQRQRLIKKKRCIEMKMSKAKQSLWFIFIHCEMILKCEIKTVPNAIKDESKSEQEASTARKWANKQIDRTKNRISMSSLR